MQSQPARSPGIPARVGFGPFVLDFDRKEISREGQEVKLQPQPMALLIALVEQAGRDMTRDDLKARVWLDHTYVDFDDGIATAIRKIRQALGDSAETPTYIRTLHRRGYRFIAPVYPIETHAAAAAPGDTPAPPTIAAPSPGLRGTRFRPIWSASGFALIVATGAGLWLGTPPKPPAADRVRPFAAFRGWPAHPAFSPNGQLLAFDWAVEPDQKRAIYTQGLDAKAPVKLNGNAASENHPVWSPDGASVAFLRDSGERWSIVTASLAGGQERKWTDFRKGATPWLDWSHNGKWFAFTEAVDSLHPPAVVLFSLATGERRTVTSPPAGWRGDSEAVFSPDSSHVAFRRTKLPSGDEDIYEVRVTGGEPQRLTNDDIGISGLTYTSDGGMLFSSLRASSIHRLWWKPPHSGQLAHVTSQAIDAVAPAMSHDGAHLAFTQLLYDVNIWSVAEDGSGAASPLIDSPFPDTSPQFSPDGKRLAYHSIRSGTNEIWVCDANGRNPIQLTDGHGLTLANPSWSPDGRQIAFEWWTTGHAAVYVVASTGGKPRPLLADGFQNTMPVWSRDGRYVYFASTRGGYQQIWKAPAAGGAPQQVTTEQGVNPEESPDGKFLWFLHNNEIRRAPLEDGKASPALTIVSLHRQGDWGNWAVANDGVYYIDWGKGAHGAIVFQGDAGNAPRTIHALTASPAIGAGLAVSPDRRTILFAQVDRDDSSIFVQ